MRFSNKELAKTKKVNAVIPDNYTELKNPFQHNETELAFKLEYINEGTKIVKWFPKSHTINIGSKYYVETWLLKTE